jgi:hypothetical protein
MGTSFVAADKKYKTDRTSAIWPALCDRQLLPLKMPPAPPRFGASLRVFSTSPSDTPEAI